jgi:hypothetical protein
MKLLGRRQLCTILEAVLTPYYARGLVCKIQGCEWCPVCGIHVPRLTDHINERATATLAHFNKS